MTQSEYVPGVCNIGPAEIARRRNLGWVSLAIVVILLAALIWFKVNPWWRLFVFLPATMSASGFLQAYFHFCSGFARRGLFNFGPAGQTQAITDDASKAMDKQKGSRITLYAALIGLTVAIVAMLI
ncbi:MAG: hypothetical protein WDN47_04750 [Candidatus Doudnabacteria bacterium]